MTDEYFYEVGGLKGPTITDDTEDFYGNPIDKEIDVTEDPVKEEEIEESIDQDEDDIVEDSEIENEKEDVDEEDEDDKEDPYKDYSPAAVYATHLKEMGFLEEEAEVSKDLEHKDLVQTMVKKSEIIGFENAKAKLIETYGGEEVLNAAQYLLNGGDPVFLNRGSALKKMSTIDTTDEKNQKDVILFAYKMQGIDDDDAKVYLETHDERGELDVKAKKAQNYIQSLHEQHNQKITNVIPQGNEEAVEKRAALVKEVIEKKELGPIKLTDAESKSLYDFITKPSYVQKRQVNGVVKNEFVTGLDKAYQSLANDLTKQIIIAKILMDDFKFDAVAKTVESNISTSVLDTLNRRTSEKKSKKTKVNAFYKKS